MNKIHVTKRDGTLELFDMEKVHKVVFWAVENLSNVSVSEIEMKAHLQFYDEMRTDDIHETLIKSASELISAEYPNYQWVAARLVMFTLRKQVYNCYTPPPIYDHVKRNVDLGVYDPELLDLYTEDEWRRVDKMIKHDRDGLLSYVAVEQFRGKYLVQNRTTGTYFETPQMAYILIAAILFGKYPPATRLQYVKDFYDSISKGTKSTITLPTPIMAGVRTPTRQFSSCVLIETGDNLDSINETASAIVDYASRRAGIGIGAGRIRARGAAVRNGEIYHTGNIPFYKYFLAALKSCSQGGVRGASATLHVPIWHYEAEDLIVLKNNKGTEENRVRHMDYSIQMNGFMYKRMLQGGNITLFSPDEVPDLYDAFFSDQVLFAELYEKYENDQSIRSKTVPALELIANVLMERNNTGRIYIMNVDHANTHGAFNPKTSPVVQSNLCQEILLSTAPITRKGRNVDYDYNNYDGVDATAFREEHGEIALCTLSSINMGAIACPEDLEKPCDLAIRALDELLDYQSYPMLAAEIPAKKRRSLGVGVSNLAYFIAKNDMKYSDGSANNLVGKYAESMSFYLLKASNNVAKEKGACDWFSETKYSQGVFPIDSYKKEVDEILTEPLHCDWSSLRSAVSEYGMRHSTVMALMPVESSSQLVNATNGIEPPRDCITVKTSKDGTLKQVVPEINRLKNKYEYLWDMPNPRGYLEIAACFQKFNDQAISSNTSYNPEKYPNNRVPMSELIKDMVYAYKYGLPTLYYQNTLDGSGEVYENETEEDDCVSCKL